MPSPLPRWAPCRLHSSTAGTAAFPVARSGRRPHYAFRGLLSVHWCYGLRTRGIAERSFPPKASTVSSPPRPLRLLRTRMTAVRWDSHPLKTHDFARRTERPTYCIHSVDERPVPEPLKDVNFWAWFEIVLYRVTLRTISGLADVASWLASAPPWVCAITGWSARYNPAYPASGDETGRSAARRDSCRACVRACCTRRWRHRPGSPGR
jgi:hypothetical protein